MDRRRFLLTSLAGAIAAPLSSVEAAATQDLKGEMKGEKHTTFG